MSVLPVEGENVERRLTVDVGCITAVAKEQRSGESALSAHLHGGAGVAVGLGEELAGLEPAVG